MIRKIIQKGSKILETQCKKVTDINSVKPVVKDLIDTIEFLKTKYEFSRGIGLAAPQIGKLMRISIVELEGKRYVLINPEIIENSKEKELILEGCISFINFRGYVARYKYVKVKTLDADGSEYFVEANDDSAMILQHEIDHLNGILYVKHLQNKEKDLIFSEKSLKLWNLLQGSS